MVITMVIPMLVTLVGRVTDVSDEHPSKACAPNNRVRVRDINISGIDNMMMIVAWILVIG